VNLPGVGKNYQDHWSVRLSAEIDPQYDTVDVLVDKDRAAQELKLYQEQKQGMLTAPSGAFAFLPSKSAVDVDAIRKIASKLTASHVSSGAQKTLDLQREWLTDDQIPHLEVVLGSGLGGSGQPGKRYMSIVVALLHPFSRGSVHVSSSDPLAVPNIDPNVLDNDVDLDLLVGGIKLARTLMSTDPLQSAVVVERSPGVAVQTDEEIKEFIKKELGTLHHPVGTASMLPKEDGGVVDVNLKVYGTANLRVIDASVIPIQIGAHTQVTTYALAEKAADIIKATCGEDHNTYGGYIRSLLWPLWLKLWRCTQVRPL